MTKPAHSTSLKESPSLHVVLLPFVQKSYAYSPGS